MDETVTDKELIFVYLVGWAGSAVGVLGLLGNAFTLVVLTRKDFRQSTSTLYLIVLCLYDFMYLAINFMIVGLDWIVFGLYPYNDFNLKYTVPVGVVLDPINGMLICASVYTTIALTIDRCIAVSLPLKWPSICTRQRVKVILVVIFIWVNVYNIPFCMEFKFAQVFVHERNKTYTLSRQTYYSHTFFHTEIFLEYVVPIVTMVVPIIAIVIPNLIILVVLKRQQRNMQNSKSGSSNSSRSNRLTAQVLFISVFTLISRVVHSVSFIVMDDTLYINECSYTCACIVATSALMVDINSAVNFICYCLFGERFRAAFVDSICGCFGMKMKGKNSNKRGPTRVFSTSVSAATTFNATTSINQRTKPD